MSDKKRKTAEKESKIDDDDDDDDEDFLTALGTGDPYEALLSSLKAQSEDTEFQDAMAAREDDAAEGASDDEEEDDGKGGATSNVDIGLTPRVESACVSTP